MKRDCNTCVYKEGSCFPSTLIFDKDKTCKSYVPDYEGYIAELEKENAKLKNQCDTLDKSLVVSTKNNIERQKIIDEWKAKINPEMKHDKWGKE